MKKMLCVLFAVLFLFATTVSVSAIEPSDDSVPNGSVFVTATEKQAFAREMDALHAQAVASGEAKTGTTEEIRQLMIDAAFASGAELASIERELALYGVYIMYSDDSSTTPSVQPYSTSADVILTTPQIMYNSANQTWSVTCGGYWRSGQYFIDYNTSTPYDVGGPDAFGIGYTSITGTYNSSVVSAYGQISSPSGENVSATYYRSDGDGSLGFGFRLQDCLKMRTTIVDWEYVGYRWYGMCTYDANFANYGGVATAYYIHTWESTRITSLGFGISGESAGIEVGYSYQDNSFEAYSSDLRFG